MPTFKADEAQNYEQRITRLIPGYDLLHDLTAAQLKTLLPDEAKILVVGAGTGKDIITLAQLNPHWHFIAQDISEDMLAIAEQNFTNLGLSARVTIMQGAITSCSEHIDAALCLLVLHFLSDSGEKQDLLNTIRAQLPNRAPLFLADLMAPETEFERESQLLACRQLGLTEVGEQRMRYNLHNEFYPLDRMRLAELLEQTGFATPHYYFKALGFTGVVCRAD
ncbi:Carboxy-S-adenosyl-L-methionine synthase [Pseudoalteromonas holothuriae]|uniref:Carboxy-S-adenosyl-L-methionine synthase n=1 Tax=Pseudoalteromonas holothuriae TaxID=2963714 RepID=A0A9W4R2I7_9GAMM|nr:MULTISPECIES: class I SAM-dependent methyltransferase [unclassified Pseudoalteromonas]CAH9063778.1 Carboxy-S-adenosyl-L-methionine synthase [Pseudoalteromonas sp. CIP111854]CAH9064644.1 Carboxy-S-adenosyl-L-methionine synthase [Pseudoalteromonas sp. CIP111951]